QSNSKDEKVVTLFTWVLFPIYREVKVGGLHKVSMWDFQQVLGSTDVGLSAAVVVTRVLEIRFGSWELQQVSGKEEGVSALVLVVLMLDMLC
ncbi:unnamed protein product, partial [Prunus brigantina]